MRWKADKYEGYTYLPSGATLTGAYAEQDYDTHLDLPGGCVSILRTFDGKTFFVPNRQILLVW